MVRAPEATLSPVALPGVEAGGVPLWPCRPAQPAGPNPLRTWKPQGTRGPGSPDGARVTLRSGGPATP
jgi:hypothetical protein